MPITLVNPMNESGPQNGSAAARLGRFEGATIALLDISKPGGSVFLDRLEVLLRSRYGAAQVIRESKPTFAKPAAPAVIEKLQRAAAVIEALAD